MPLQWRTACNELSEIGNFLAWLESVPFKPIPINSLHAVRHLSKYYVIIPLCHTPQ